MKRKTEDIIEDAEIAACYFRALVSNGVDVQAAVSLTSSYIGNVIIVAQMQAKPPREPWQDGPPA